MGKYGRKKENGPLRPVFPRFLAEQASAGIEFLKVSSYLLSLR